MYNLYEYEFVHRGINSINRNLPLVVEQFDGGCDAEIR